MAAEPGQLVGQEEGEVLVGVVVVVLLRQTFGVAVGWTSLQQASKQQQRNVKNFKFFFCCKSNCDSILLLLMLLVPLVLFQYNQARQLNDTRGVGHDAS